MQLPITAMWKGSLMLRCFATRIDRRANRVISALFLSATILILVQNVLAQPPRPDTLWTYSYSSPINDGASSILRLSDGGFVVAGVGRASDSITGGLVIRLDSLGHQVWIHGYSQISGISEIIRTADHGFAASGTCTNPGELDVLKLDSNGVMQWVRCMSWNIVEFEGAVSLTETTDGRIAALTGGAYTANPDVDLVCLSANGDSLWSRTYGGAAEDHGGAVLATPEGGFFIAGSMNHQACVWITDSAGTVLSTTTFGSPTRTEGLGGAYMTVDHDYIVVGNEDRDAGGFTHDPLVARISATGDTLWTRVYPLYSYSSTSAITGLSDGYFAVVGTIIEDGGFVLALDSNGDSSWTALFSVPNRRVSLFATCLSADSNLVLAGETGTLVSNSCDVYVVRTVPHSDSVHQPHSMPVEIAFPSNFPNPFNSTTNIRFCVDRPGEVRFSVFDIAGRLVDVEDLGFRTTGTHLYHYNASKLPSGCYLYIVNRPDGKQCGKMLLLR